MPTEQETLLDVAWRLRSTCRCNWSADDRNLVIAYLAPIVDAQPEGFPLRLEERGTSWWLEKA